MRDTGVFIGQLVTYTGTMIGRPTMVPFFFEKSMEVQDGRFRSNEQVAFYN